MLDFSSNIVLMHTMPNNREHTSLQVAIENPFGHILTSSGIRWASDATKVDV